MGDALARATHNERNKDGGGERVKDRDHARGSKNGGLFDKDIRERVDQREEKCVDGATARTTHLTA